MKHSALEQALHIIEALDKCIVQLLTLRRQFATELAEVAPRPEAAQSLDERVAAVVSRLARGNPGPLDNQRLAAIFETIIRLTEPLDVAISTRNSAAKKG
jgi:chorismate mutase